MTEKSLKEQLQSFGLSKILNLLQENPEKNIPIVLEWIDRLDVGNVLQNQREAVHNLLDNPENMWYKFTLDLWNDIDDQVRATLFENFIVNASVIGMNRLEKARAEQGCNIPWAILLDPTSACNLNCTGCWAAEYDKQLSLSYEELDSIIRQGKAMGTYFYLYTGGEPLLRKKDIIKLCEEHHDCIFSAFTNGTLIDEAFAAEMLRVKNFVPAISIEGYEAETDDRRGQGTYRKAIRAMEILKEHKLGFGASVCFTRKNTDIIGSEAFIDDLIARGNKFVWFFTYMPVGVGAPTDLMVTAEQREFMYRQVRAFRETKPIFSIDFWNDAEYVNGCIAGGRCYMHINANGDVEPCAFIHYSDSNIREKSLLEAYNSPLFMQYHDRYPFNENMLRPCPLLDNHGRLAEMVHASGAYSTDLAAREDVDALCAKCKQAAAEWTPVAERLWAESH